MVTILRANSQTTGAAPPPRLMDGQKLDFISAVGQPGRGTPLSRPRVLSPSIGLLLKQVGAKDWVLDAT